jgi:hypothetical protein
MNDDRHERPLFEAELPCRQIHCICGHPVTAHDFRIEDFEDAQELRASCSNCRRILLRITWDLKAGAP